MKDLNVNEVALPVRFNEVDQMRIVHHSVYFVYMEEARFRFAERALGITQDDLDRWGIQVAVRTCTCEYLWPARFGDTVLVRVRMVPSQKAIIHLKYDLLRAADGKRLATGETVKVLLDGRGKLLVRTPDVFRERVEAAVARYPELVEQP